ncbi:hypothetical protein FA13DRAFT_1722942 [Coprinellus micaceus]|uniref:Uncharacterized protein n=1 Tax=Coprinellus micaceus TaxID=71717 RepID=A0A4Y7RCB8_COPMI|nr:hypothetical protein FA13DRAFT_1722942 [Coprinellus micaceus]
MTVHQPMCRLQFHYHILACKMYSMEIVQLGVVYSICQFEECESYIDIQSSCQPVLIVIIHPRMDNCYHVNYDVMIWLLIYGYGVISESMVHYGTPGGCSMNGTPGGCSMNGNMWLVFHFWNMWSVFQARNIWSMFQAWIIQLGWNTVKWGSWNRQAHVPYLGLVAGAWSSGTGYGSAEHGMGNGTTLHRALGMEEFNGFVKGVPWVTEVFPQPVPMSMRAS